MRFNIISWKAFKVHSQALQGAKAPKNTDFVFHKLGRGASTITWFYWFNPDFNEFFDDFPSAIWI